MDRLSLCPHCAPKKGTSFQKWFSDNHNNYQPCAQCHGIGHIPPEVGYQRALLPALLPKNPAENRPAA